MKKITIAKSLTLALLCLWALTTIFPFVWVINNSFKASSLVLNDSFSPAFTSIYQYDQYGQIVRERVMRDEHGRVVYDKLLFDEAGAPVYENAVESPTLNADDPFTSLLGGMAARVTNADAPLQAYDTVGGVIVYDMASPPVKLTPTLGNYMSAFTNRNINILTGYKNSLIVSGSVMVLVMLLSTMMAFAMTRWRFKGRAVLMALITAALMFPAFSTIVPVYRMLSNIKLFNTLQGVVLVQTAGNLAFACTVMMGFVASLPYELEEAAFMEGCGVYRIFLRIVLPISRPALATVAIFTFIWSYNDLFVQMVLIRSQVLMPVCAILREISSQYGTDFGLMAAAVTIVVVPVLALYMLLQRNIIKGLTAGAVKG